MNLGNRISIISIVALLTFIGLFSSCSSVKKATVSRPLPETSIIISGNLSSLQKSLLKEAESWLGTPYLYAGSEKGIGTDCSGLIMQVYLSSCDLKLPRNSAKQAEFCLPLSAEDVEAGDLVFFATGSDPLRVSHVGIMMDAESFIHASTSKGVVVSKLSNPYYKSRLLMYGRVPNLVSGR